MKEAERFIISTIQFTSLQYHELGQRSPCIYLYMGWISFLARGMDVSFIQNIQTSCGLHVASYSAGNEDFSSGEAAGA
jgi:hypothetical protein